MKPKMEEYTSGWAKFYERTEKGNKNISSLDELTFISSMAFKELSARNEDLLIAEGKGHSLNRKIKVRKTSFIEEQQFVLIGTTLYYVYRIDIDLENNEIYVYMESLRQGIEDE